MSQTHVGVPEDAPIGAILGPAVSNDLEVIEKFWLPLMKRKQRAMYLQWTREDLPRTKRGGSEPFRSALPQIHATWQGLVGYLALTNTLDEEARDGLHQLRVFLLRNSCTKCKRFFDWIKNLAHWCNWLAFEEPVNIKPSVYVWQQALPSGLPDYSPFFRGSLSWVARGFARERPESLGESLKFLELGYLKRIGLPVREELEDGWRHPDLDEGLEKLFQNLSNSNGNMLEGHERDNLLKAIRLFVMSFIKGLRFQQDSIKMKVRGSASFLTHCEEGGRSQEVLEWVQAYLEQPLGDLVPEGSAGEILDPLGNVVFRLDGDEDFDLPCHHFIFPDIELPPGDRESDLGVKQDRSPKTIPGQDGRYMNIAVLASFKEGLRTEELYLQKVLPEGLEDYPELPPYLAWFARCEFEDSNLDHVRVRAHPLPEEGPKVRAVTIGPTWLYVLHSIPRKFLNVLLAQKPQTKHAVTGSIRLWDWLQSLSKAHRDPYSGRLQDWSKSTSDKTGFHADPDTGLWVSTDLEKATDLIAHDIAEAINSSLCEGLDLESTGFLSQSIRWKCSRQFYRGKHHVVLPEDKHVVGVMMGEGLSYPLLNLHGLFAFAWAKTARLTGMSCRAVINEGVYITCPPDVTNVGDDQIGRLVDEREFFLLTEAYSLLGAKTSDGRHLCSRKWLTLAEEHASLQPDTETGAWFCSKTAVPPTPLEAGYGIETPRFHRGFWCEFEKADLVKARLIVPTGPQAYFGKVSALTGSLRYVETVYGEKNSLQGSARLQSLSRVWALIWQNEEIASDVILGRSKMLPFWAGGIHHFECLGHNAWDSLEEIDQKILRIMHGSSVPDSVKIELLTVSAKLDRPDLAEELDEIVGILLEGVTILDLKAQLVSQDLSLRTERQIQDKAWKQAEVLAKEQYVSVATLWDIITQGEDEWRDKVKSRTRSRTYNQYTLVEDLGKIRKKRDACRIYAEMYSLPSSSAGWPWGHTNIPTDLVNWPWKEFGPLGLLLSREHPVVAPFLLGQKENTCYFKVA
jgi:hypothetical protein